MSKERERGGMESKRNSETEVNMQLGRISVAIFHHQKPHFLFHPVQMNCGLASNRNYLKQSAWIHPPLHYPMNALDTPRKDKYSNMHNSHGITENSGAPTISTISTSGGCFSFPFKYSSFRWSCFWMGRREINTRGIEKN